ncbi:hypothetical protein AVEN_42121-1 [Araneus ventricosus]|uniref:STPR domain-containing protein n=1 Tax=Araneus ventricosus TaxID=182803 RepID=A0A4Y2D273_ARAVE|nr:hypothetical protein AVEN_42121-1 [Araneus ventricosus]
MPKRKRKSIGQIPTKAKKIKLLRANETNAQRQQRLQAMKDRDKTSRAKTNKIVVYKRCGRKPAYYEQMNENKREHRLQNVREQVSTSRVNESVDQREQRLQKMREQASTSRTIEYENEREHRLQNVREQVSTSRVTESADQREHRL